MMEYLVGVIGVGIVSLVVFLIFKECKGTNLWYLYFFGGALSLILLSLIPVFVSDGNVNCEYLLRNLSVVQENSTYFTYNLTCTPNTSTTPSTFSLYYSIGLMVLFGLGFVALLLFAFGGAVKLTGRTG